jgi:hypothetical protein
VKPIGRTLWGIAGGFMPLHSTGPEPDFTSHDELCVLNAGDRMANVSITILYAEEHTDGPYLLTVAPRRVRHVRFNDFIFPVAMPLEAAYGAVIHSDVPVVVQFTREATQQAAEALLGTTAYPEPD